MQDTTSRAARLALLAERIADADAILIGGGSGLSSAAGYEHYHWSGEMARTLAPFRAYYGFTSPFAGFYHAYSRYSEQWGYYSQYMRFMREASTGQPYLDLRKLVGDKPTFVLSTNVDGQFERVFDEAQICNYQGSFLYCQCSQPCTDEIWDNADLLTALTDALDPVTLSVPPELVPRCPHCGRVLVPWVRDDTFLQGAAWQAAYDRYRAFLREHLIDRPGKVVLLELGVGEMTPSIIKLPFWQLCQRNEGVFYATLNRTARSAPSHLGDRATFLEGDLADTLRELRGIL